MWKKHRKTVVRTSWPGAPVSPTYLRRRQPEDTQNTHLAIFGGQTTFRRPTSDRQPSEDQLQKTNFNHSTRPGPSARSGYIWTTPPPGFLGKPAGTPGFVSPGSGSSSGWYHLVASSLRFPASSVHFPASSISCPVLCPFSGFRGPFSDPRSVFDGFCMHFGCHVGGNFQSNVQFCCNVTKPSKCF